MRLKELKITTILKTLFKISLVLNLYVFLTGLLHHTQQFHIKMMMLWGFHATPVLGEAAPSLSVPGSDPVPFSLRPDRKRLPYPMEAGAMPDPGQQEVVTEEKETLLPPHP